MNARTSRSFAHLSARLTLSFLGAAALASVACGGDDYYGINGQKETAGDGGPLADSSTISSSDATAGDASSGDATSTGDATSMGDSSRGNGDGGHSTDAAPIVITLGGDGGDGGVCSVTGGLFQLDAPSAGSSALCPTQNVLCSVSVATSTCTVTTRCVSGDGGVGGLLSLLSIPVEVVGPNDDIDYDASLPLPEVLGVDAGRLGFDCAVQFGDDSVALGVSCKATVPIVGTVDVCAYAGLPIDGGL